MKKVRQLRFLVSEYMKAGTILVVTGLVVYYTLYSRDSVRGISWTLEHTFHFIKITLTLKIVPIVLIEAHSAIALF